MADEHVVAARSLHHAPVDGGVVSDLGTGHTLTSGATVPAPLGVNGPAMREPKDRVPSPSTSSASGVQRAGLTPFPCAAAVSDVRQAETGPAGGEPECDHPSFARDGDLLIWRCEECGEVAPWSDELRRQWPAGVQ